jgi:hypothetical protein
MSVCLRVPLIVATQRAVSVSMFSPNNIFVFYAVRVKSRNSPVGIATGYGLNDQGIKVRVPGGKNFYFSMLSRLALRPTQPPIQWLSRTLSLGVKRPGRGAAHSPPTSAEVMKMWSYTSTPPYRHNFTFLFFFLSFLLPM